VLSLLKTKLVKPFLALSDQLRQAQHALSDQLRQAQQGMSDQLHQAQRGISDHLLTLHQEIGSLAANVGTLRREAEHLRGVLDDTKQLVATGRQEHDRRDQQLQQQLAALIMRMPAEGKNRGEVYFDVLHAVGVLNYENYTVSGERRFLKRFLERYPTAVVIDVGANAGQYSELVRELAPEAVIHAFEPHPVSFAALAQLAAKIGVAAHPLALGETHSTIEIFDYADEAGSQHASVYREVIEGVHRRPACSWTIRCETLDSIADEWSLTGIGLLKIDTEGHELAVLKGSRRLLEAGAIDVIQFEFNEMNVISRVFMRDFFALLPNYRIYRLLSEGAIAFETYDPTFMEVFAYQNMACIRRDLDPSWIHAS
jgi:FkbM family methyltransferase